MNKVLLAMLQARLCHLDRRHWHDIRVVIGVTGLEPPSIDFPRDSTIRTILLRRVGLVRVPHGVKLFVLLLRLLNTRRDLGVR
jgi:hypothetical protein